MHHDSGRETGACLKDCKNRKKMCDDCLNFDKFVPTDELMDKIAKEKCLDTEREF